jgi:hypothetical protein
MCSKSAIRSNSSEKFLSYLVSDCFCVVNVFWDVLLLVTYGHLLRVSIVPNPISLCLAPNPVNTSFGQCHC